MSGSKTNSKIKYKNQMNNNLKVLSKNTVTIIN